MRVVDLLNDGNEVDVEQLSVFSDVQINVLKPWDERTIFLFEALSKRILCDKKLLRNGQFVAFAFWIRKSNMQKIKEGNKVDNLDNVVVKPLGLLFHVAPANVDTIFLYSLVIGLLMGNKNIVRLSNRIQSKDINLLVVLISEILKDPTFTVFTNYLSIITYSRNDQIGEWFSLKVDARVIWGGDNTVKKFKEYTTRPSCKDIFFPDRISGLVLNSKKILEYGVNEFSNFISRFYNDIFYFDQLGCSSPRIALFIGSKDDSTVLRDKIIEQTTKLEFQKGNLDINSVASLKLNQLITDCLEDRILNASGNSVIQFAQITEKRKNLISYHGCGGGFLYYEFLDSLYLPFELQTVELQTISYEGFSKMEISDLILNYNGKGLDRLVPLGKALQFHYIWDGKNLFEQLSRRLYWE